MKGVRKQCNQVEDNGLEYAVAGARSLGITRVHAGKIL